MTYVTSGGIRRRKSPNLVSEAELKVWHSSLPVDVDPNMLIHFIKELPYVDSVYYRGSVYHAKVTDKNISLGNLERDIVRFISERGSSD